MPPLAFTWAKYAAPPATYSSPVPAMVPVSGATWPMTISSAAMAANGPSANAAAAINLESMRFS